MPATTVTINGVALTEAQVVEAVGVSYGFWKGVRP